MRRVAHEPVPVEPGREHPLALGDRGGGVHPVEPGGAPGGLVALDDEGRLPLVEAVRVHLEDAVRVLDHDEREGVEAARGAEPRVLRLPHVEVGAEVLRVLAADRAVDAVGGDDEIRVAEPEGGEVGVVAHLGLEADVDAHVARALLEDGEQPLARDPAEAVSAGSDRDALEVDVDVVPVGEVVGDRLVGGRIGVAEVLERLIGEDDAPPEGVVGPIALEHGDPMRGIRALEQEREVETRRSTADRHDLHVIPPRARGRGAPARLF